MSYFTLNYDKEIVSFTDNCRKLYLNVVYLVCLVCYSEGDKKQNVFKHPH